MALDYEKVKEDLTSVGREVKDKAKEMSQTAKLKLDIHFKGNELDQLYAALGKVYYAAHQNEEGIPEEVMFRGIRKAEEELFDLKKQLKEIREASADGE